MTLEGRGQDSDEWQLESYRQGSDACRNYSSLTMRVRTLAQQVLGLSIAGLAATYLKDDSGILDGTASRAILVGGGLTLVLLAISLGFVDWHYQSAFSAIRDSLARAEAERRVDGPWRAHLSVRSRLADHFASYLPFVFLFAIGCVGACVGMFGIGIGWWLSAPLVAAAFAFFFYLSSRAKKRDRKMQAEIDDIVARCPASARPV